MNLPAIRSLAGNVVIAAFLSLFVVINLKAFGATGDATYALVAFNESLYVFLNLVRRRPVATSTSVSDWGIGFSGTFLGTLLRPAPPFAQPVGSILIVVGTVVNIFAVASLNRSIGTVPGERRIKTRGLYRYVRHPMYGSDLSVLFGYLLANCSWWNAAVAVCTAALLMMRIDREERFLSRNEQYRAYLKTTPWKLLPLVY